ncbi:MAG: hypothetical protein K0R66_1381 [Gammaproteobacteria bacterium]|jgi:hypothetical protein|nr:hypothetical protein [Gammaproteobacteria bacterium]
MTNHKIVAIAIQIGYNLINIAATPINNAQPWWLSQKH